MISSIVAEQATKLAEKYVGASLKDLKNGTFLCTIPEFPLPEGWSKSKTTVYFIVPCGYPIAKPAYFWTDWDLCLRSGGSPCWTDNRWGHGIPENTRWWGYTPNLWSPSHDTLITYAKFIGTRFMSIR